jgi:hypothetical protein
MNDQIHTSQIERNQLLEKVQEMEKKVMEKPVESLASFALAQTKAELI